MYRILQSPIIGQAQEQQWAQVVLNAAQNVVVVFSVAGVQASAFGHRSVEVLSQLAPSTPIEFHQAMEHMVAEAESSDTSLELAAGFFVDQKCILVTYQGKIILRRHQKIGQLLQSDQELKVIEGSVQAHDAFVFATTHGDVLMPEVQRQLHLGADTEVMTAALAPMLSTTSEQGLVAISYVLVQEPKTGESALPFFIAGGALIKRIKKLRYAMAQLPHLLQKNGKKLLKPRIVIPVLLVIGVIIGVMVSTNSSKKRQLLAAQAITQPAQAKIDEIKKNLGSQDLLVSRQQVEDVKSQLEAALPNFKTQPIAAAAVQQELDHVNQFYDSISGKQHVNVLPTFFDLRLVESDFLASRVDIFENTLLFLDTGKKKMLSLDIDKKQPNQLAIGDYANPIQDFSFDGKNVFILSNGIYRVDLSGTTSTPSAQIKAADDANTAAQFIRTFNQNIYVFNGEKTNIFRYALNTDGNYSDPIGWLRPDQRSGLGDVSSFAIDSDVWLGTKQGTIRRFTAGKEVPFTIAGLKDDFSSPLIVFTKDSLNNLYVLEPAKNRIVILNKNGEFLKEMKSDSLSAATQLVASETLQKMYVLNGSLVYEVAF